MILSEQQKQIYANSMFLKNPYVDILTNENEGLYSLHENYTNYITNFDSNINFLNEAYYGKNEILKRIEGYFDEFRVAIKSGQNPNKLPCMDKLKKDICELFNVEDISYSIIPSGMLNSMTVSMIYDNVNNINKKNFELSRNKYGICFKDSKNKKLVISVYSQLIVKLTSAECVAILLHEIGHNFFLTENFYKCTKLKIIIDFIMQNLANILIFAIPLAKGKIKGEYNKYGTKYNSIILFIMLCQLALNVFYILSGKTHRMYDKDWSATANVDKKFKKLADENEKELQKKQNKFKKFLNKICELLSIPGHLFMTAYTIIYLLPITMFIKLIQSTTNSGSHGYSNEKFADNFTTSYGYGEELVNAFKVNGSFDSAPESDKTALKNPILKTMYQSVIATRYLIVYLMDPHPSNQTRLQKTVSKLEYELNNNKELTASQKIDIKKQIDTIKKILSTNMEDMSAATRIIFYDSGIIDAKDQIAQKMDYSDKELFDFENKLLGKLMEGKEDL